MTNSQWSGRGNGADHHAARARWDSEGCCRCIDLLADTRIDEGSGWPRSRRGRLDRGGEREGGEAEKCSRSSGRGCQAGLVGVGFSQRRRSLGDGESFGGPQLLVKPLTFNSHLSSKCFWHACPRGPSGAEIDPLRPRLSVPSAERWVNPAAGFRPAGIRHVRSVLSMRRRPDRLSARCVSNISVVLWGGDRRGAPSLGLWV